MKRDPGLTLPFFGGGRSLADEPLTAEDWEKVWLAHQGFRAQVRLIVTKARKRAAESSGLGSAEDRQAARASTPAHLRPTADDGVAPLPSPSKEQEG